MRCTRRTHQCASISTRLPPLNTWYRWHELAVPHCQGQSDVAIKCIGNLSSLPWGGFVQVVDWGEMGRDGRRRSSILARVSSLVISPPFLCLLRHPTPFRARPSKLLFRLFVIFMMTFFAPFGACSTYLIIDKISCFGELKFTRCATNNKRTPRHLRFHS